jgi:methyl-accepting chemotaxis protein
MTVKRKIYLIEPKFQLKFSFYICVVVFISSLIYPFLIFDIINNLIARYPDSAQALQGKRTELIIFICVMQLGFIALIGTVSIFISHKIAGPIYKLKKYLKLIRDEQSINKLNFRNGDYFQELAEEFNMTIGQLQDQHRSDFSYLGEISTYLHNISLVVPDDKKVVLNEINKKLAEIQNRFNNVA